MNTSRDLLSPLQKEVLRMLEINGPMTRQELMALFHKPRTTIYDQVRKLIQCQLVRAFSRPLNHIGRPKVYFKCIEED